MIDWDEFRRGDDHGTIDLKRAFGALHNQGTMTIHEWGVVVHYFRRIERLQPINSKQVAAVIITDAQNLVLHHRGRL